MFDVSPTNLNEKLRSGKRLPISMPIVLRGRDAEGHAFIENTHTVVVNKGGAKILSKHSMKVGDHVVIRIPHLNREEPLTVVWASEQKRDKNYFDLGVGLDKASDFWGVHFPEEQDIANRKGGPGSGKQPETQPTKAADARITQPLGIPVQTPPEPPRVEPPPRLEPVAEAPLPPAITVADQTPPAPVPPPSAAPPTAVFPEPAVSDAPQAIPMQPEVVEPAKPAYTPPLPSTGAESPAVSSRMLGVLQEFVAEALEASIAAVLRQSRQKAEEDLARTRQEVIEQAQQLLRNEVEAARARQEQYAADAGVHISAVVAEAMQAAMRSAQDALVADRTASEEHLRQTATKEGEAVQEGLRRASQEILGRVQEQLAQVAHRQSQDFERDLKDALRSSVAGWGEFLADSQRGAAGRVQEAINSTVRQALEQTCQEAQESAVRAARTRLASMLCEFDSGLTEAESRAAGRYETTLDDVKRRSMEQAAASFAQLVSESAQRHSDTCRHAEEALGRAIDERMHGHLTHFEMRLSEFERRAAASLEHTLTGIMDKAEEETQGKLAQAAKSSVDLAQSRLDGVVSSSMQLLDSQARDRIAQHAAGFEAQVGVTANAAMQSVDRITQETVASAQKEALDQTQVSLRAAVEAALEQLEMRAIGVVHHNEEACNQALAALAEAHEARLSAHLAECQVKLSNSARRILQELARSLASLNFGTEKPVE